ncbi:hypothetical protein IVA91_27475 [Bradyrhizobium sp. 153]|nr:hypothetical protein [Bradyrhizobium sp. 153]
MDVTVARVASFQRPAFNAPWTTDTVWIVTMYDAAGHCIVSKSSSFRAEAGERFSISATVKEHSQYDDEAQTVVQRIKAKEAVT